MSVFGECYSLRGVDLRHTHCQRASQWAVLTLGLAGRRAEIADRTGDAQGLVARRL